MNSILLGLVEIHAWSLRVATGGDLRTSNHRTVQNRSKIMATYAKEPFRTFRTVPQIDKNIARFEFSIFDIYIYIFVLGFSTTWFKIST